jgi:predicted nucleic acid-binding protein
MILVDTSVWIDFIKGINSHQRRVLHWLIQEDEDICLTEIVLTEVLQGVRDDKDFLTVKTCLLEFPIYSPKGVETYLNAAGLYRDCRRKGVTVRKTVDCIIASICIENGLGLLHKDRDYDLIADCTNLKIVK